VYTQSSCCALGSRQLCKLYVSDEAQDQRVGTATVLTSPSPMRLFFLFPKIKSALKGTRFESVHAVKAKVTEFVNKLSENDTQHCFHQRKIDMERCRDREGEYTEGDNISIVLMFRIEKTF